MLERNNPIRRISPVELSKIAVRDDSALITTTFSPPLSSGQLRDVMNHILHGWESLIVAS